MTNEFVDSRKFARQKPSQQVSKFSAIGFLFLQNGDGEG
jgi:hypothetical protein